MFRLTRANATFKGVLRRHKYGADGLPLYNELSKSWLAREGERWWVLDAKGEQLPRVAEIAAHYMVGKHRPDFTPGIFTGDNVIIVNCKDVVMVGDDWVRIPITWNTAWAGGRYRIRLSDMYERDCCMLMQYYIRKSIGKLHGRNLKCRHAPVEKAWLYEDGVHPHADKSPIPIAWKDRDASHVRWTSELNQRRWSVNAFMK